MPTSITTSTQANVASIISQRAFCYHSHFWSARLVTGRVYVELDDNNQAYAGCHSDVVLNDGLAHRVVVRRVAGVLSITVDCGPAVTCPATTDMSMTLAPLGGPPADPCIGTAGGTVLLDGTVREECARPL